MFGQFYRNEPYGYPGVVQGTWRSDHSPIRMESEAKASAVMKFRRGPKASPVRLRPSRDAVLRLGSLGRRLASWNSRSMGDVETAMEEAAAEELQTLVGERPEAGAASNNRVQRL